MVKNGNRNVNSATETKKPKAMVSMVPIFSWRTVITIAIGLVIGGMLGLGYWVVSPSLGMTGSSDVGLGAGGGTGTATVTESTGLFGLLGLEPTGPYISDVTVQIVSPGSEYIPLRNLQQNGEYYAAKANSLPFLKFLQKELTENVPQSSYTIDKLDNIIMTQFDWDSVPPAFRIRVVGASEQEAALLVESVPQIFRDYLIAEENDKRQKEYRNTLEEIDSVKEALYQAEKELDVLTPQNIVDNPDYIALNARLEALQSSLDTQAAELSTMITMGSDVDQEYAEVLEQMREVSDDLVEAEQELMGLNGSELDSDISSNADYITLNAKIRALERELDRLMTGWTETTSDGVVLEKAGLAEMIANDDITGQHYSDTLEKVERVSLSLSETKEELDTLVGNSDNNPTITLDSRLAQIKVDTLNAELSALQERLIVLAGMAINGASQTNAQQNFDRTAIALSEAKRELVNLESQLGYDRLSADLDYKIAQDKISNLEIRLENLTEQLGALVGENIESQEADSLVSGTPSMPRPVLPDRPKASNTLMMAAVAGAVIGWLLLNFRWIAKGMPSSGKKEKESAEDEEDEE